MFAGILVWSERADLAQELLGEASRLSSELGGEVWFCASGGSATELESLAAGGANIVYLTDKDLVDPSQWVAVLATVISETQPELVLIGATKTGMEVAPRVAERCRAAYGPWAIDIRIDKETHTTSASCMLYAGTGVATYEFSRPMTVLSVAPRTFQPHDDKGRQARVESVVLADGAAQLRVVGERPKPAGGASLQEAKAVVDVGRGVKNLEDLELLHALVELVDGQLACSRPVSSDRDWMPDWLGLSGAKIKPELCLTIGISGAIQHVIGIRDSRVIVAVNNDENAAIFSQADVGVVADLYEFLPVFIERLNARGARPSWL